MNKSELLKKFSPIVYFHKDEKYFPCSADWLLKNSSILDYNEKPSLKINSPSNLDIYKIASKYDFKRNNDNSLILSFDSSVYTGEIPYTNVPCYGYVSEFNDRIYLRYFFLYAKNGEYSIIGLVDAGMHPGDIESIVIELTKNGELLRIFYGSHRQVDSKWVDAKKVEFEDGKPVVYSALNGHGLYEKEGVVFRKYGFANDYLGKSKRWQPNVVEYFDRKDPRFNIETMGWTLFWGRIGGSFNGDDSGIMGVPDKEFNLNPDEIKQSDLNPPPIISYTKYKIFITLVHFVLLTITYFIAYFILKIVDNYMDGQEKDCFNFKEHMISILLLFIFFAIFKEILTYLLNKYIPS